MCVQFQDSVFWLPFSVFLHIPSFLHSFLCGSRDHRK
uniref:Uncharacterized protein n=1 Tax=Rhizophora mucronata TaxID=61149 RepID=A0A2P2IU60_RHIMU